LETLAKEKGIGVRAMAFMWSAVVQMKISCPKSSIHGMLGQNISSVSAAKLAGHITIQMKKTIRDNIGDASIIIIDEISTVSALLFYAIDRVLQQAFDNTSPFGGKSIVMLGDFKQIAPCGEKTIAEVLTSEYTCQPNLKVNINQRGNKGKEKRAMEKEEKIKKIHGVVAGLFSKFHKIELTEQERAKGDEVQTKLLAEITFQRSGPPLTSQLLNGFQELTSELLAKDPAFQDAPYAVASNEERIVFNMLQAKRFAMKNKQPIFRWVLRIRSGKQTKSDDLSEAFISSGGADELVVLFVPGMPMIMTSKCAHSSWNLVNGTHCNAHSFSYKDTTILERIMSKSGSFKPGEIVKVDQPDYINVECLVNPHDNSKGTFIHPVAQEVNKNAMTAFYKHAPPSVRSIWTTGKTISVPSTQTHALEAGFAVTFEKLQGSTVKRLVLVLNKISAYKLGTITLNKIYVAMSRVRNHTHMAVFPSSESDMLHLTKLTFSDGLKAWDNNYQDGQWIKKNITYLPALLPALEKVKNGGGLYRVSLKELRMLAKAVGLLFQNKSLSELRNSLKDVWNNYETSQQ
jgi:hypothetical protein